MRKPNLSKVEKLVASAEKRGTKSTRASAKDPRSALRAIEKKAEAILTDAFPRFDKPGLDRLQRQHEVELRRLDVDAKRRTIEGAAKASRRLETLVSAERAALAELPADPFGPNSNLLLKVDFIRSWPTPDYLRDSHQAPGVNWAKYSFNSGRRNIGHFHEKVSFYNVWQNPRNVPVLIDVFVRLTAYGHIHCSAKGSGIGSWLGWAGTTKSRADVSARLTLWGLWTEPAPIFLVDSVPLGSCSAAGGFFSSSSNTTIENDEHGGVAPGVATTGFAVPAGASILIEASLAVDYEVEIGVVDVDFANEDLFKVGWAYATVTLPPEMMVNA
jgi:hypothetical protein